MLLLVFLDAGGVEGALGRGGGEGVAARGERAVRRQNQVEAGRATLQCGLYLYMCRLRGPSRPDDTRPEGAESEVTAPGLNGLEWSKVETAIDARVLAPETSRQFSTEVDRTECCLPVAEMTITRGKDAAPWTVMSRYLCSS